jgi:hypothetical protein
LRQFLVHPRKLLGLGDMTTVRATIRVLVAALIALGGNVPAWSGEVEEAHAALMRNDHAAALKKYKSAATKGNAQAQKDPRALARVLGQQVGPGHGVGKCGHGDFAHGWTIIVFINQMDIQFCKIYR